MKKTLGGVVGLLVSVAAGGVGLYVLRSYIVSALLFYLALAAVFVVAAFLVGIGLYSWSKVSEGMRELKAEKREAVPVAASVSVVPIGK